MSYDPSFRFQRETNEQQPKVVSDADDNSNARNASTNQGNLDESVPNELNEDRNTTPPSASSARNGVGARYDSLDLVICIHKTVIS